MKAEELRQGNWIRTCTPNMPIMIPHVETQVQGITLFGQVIVCHTPQIEGFSMPAKHTMGIPLTEEWLIKFGFEDKHGYEYPSYRKNLLLVYGRPDKEWCFIIGKGLSSFESDARPLYVHQLQNLYFALTGEELTIKE